MRSINSIILIFFILISGFNVSCQNSDNENTVNIDLFELQIKKIWEEASYKNLLKFDVFFQAMKGYDQYDSFKRGKIVIIDYSIPSTEKRFYVIDLINNTLLFHSLTAHGKNTGENTALIFSNKANSLKSSLGFYITAETYFGKHGYSLKLDGLEKGINDNARNRSIVIHGAEYVSEEFIKKHGRLGRSWGCPALPVKDAKKIIDCISGGVCIFIYSNNSNYHESSSFLK